MEDVRVLRADNGTVQGVEVCVVPATAQNVSEQHVRCTLVAAFPPSYPAVQPLVTIRNPRGIDDSVLTKIEQEITARCLECEGNPVLYELIEMVRENLTANNAPSCPCTICLYHFSETDHFTKTQCFHYFHKHCLGRYISSCEAAHEAALAEQQLPWQRRQDALLLLCPVCREPITVKESAASLLCSPGPALEVAEQQWRPDAPEVQTLRRNMTKLFKRQQQRGGIIDLEHEKNKFLVSQAVEPRIEDRPVRSVTDSPLSDEGENSRADDSHPDDLNLGDNELESPVSDSAVCSPNGGRVGAEDALLAEDKEEQRPLSPPPPDAPSAGTPSANTEEEQGEGPPLLSHADNRIKGDRRVNDSDAADLRRGRGRGWGGRGGGGGFRGLGPQERGGGYGGREGRGGSTYNNGGAGGRGGRSDVVQQRGGFRGRGRGRSQWGGREGYSQRDTDESYDSRHNHEGGGYYHEYNNAQQQQQQRGVGNIPPKAPPSRQYYNGNSHQQQPPTSRFGPPRMQQQYHSNNSYKQYSNNQYKSRGDHHAHAVRYTSNEARGKLAANDRSSAATYES